METRDGTAETFGPRQRHINRALNVPRGDNQFYLMEKKTQEGRGAMMPKTERNSYHTRCAGIFMHVYVGVCTSIVTNLCKGQCPIVAVRGEFVSPIYRLATCLAPITVTLPLLSLSLVYASASRCGNRINTGRRIAAGLLGNDLQFLEIPGPCMAIFVLD